jgi:hypothetical protein
MGRPVVNIPDEMLPEVVQDCLTSWNPPALVGLSSEEKARRYLEEACRTLALFKYWASKAE